MIDLARGRLDEAGYRLYALYQSLDQLSPNSHTRLKVYLIPRLARLELMKGNTAGCLSYIREVLEKRSTPAPYQRQLSTLTTCCDCHITTAEPHLALRYAIVGCITSRKVEDMSYTVGFIQRIGDLLLTLDSDIQSARQCYEVVLEYMAFEGARRHHADCLTRLGLLSLVEGDRDAAKANLSRARKLYIASEDPEGCRYCEGRLEECTDPLPKVRCVSSCGSSEH